MSRLAELDRRFRTTPAVPPGTPRTPAYALLAFPLAAAAYVGGPFLDPRASDLLRRLSLGAGALVAVLTVATVVAAKVRGRPRRSATRSVDPVAHVRALGVRRPFRALTMLGVFVGAIGIVAAVATAVGGEASVAQQLRQGAAALVFGALAEAHVPAWRQEPCGEPHPTPALLRSVRAVQLGSLVAAVVAVVGVAAR